jgi:hypothetical protein
MEGDWYYCITRTVVVFWRTKLTFDVRGRIHSYVVQPSPDATRHKTNTSLIHQSQNAIFVASLERALSPTR